MCLTMIMTARGMKENDFMINTCGTEMNGRKKTCTLQPVMIFAIYSTHILHIPTAVRSINYSSNLSGQTTVGKG